jgi:hypothetical protein
VLVASASRNTQITPVGSVKRSARWRLDRDIEIGAVIGSVKVYRR